MHLNRAEADVRIPIARKGTKYVVVAQDNKKNSVPVLIAVRDMLGLAKTAREVKAMIHQKLVKVNGRLVSDYKESVMIFNILELDKKYKLSIKSTGRFYFEETKDNFRIGKIIRKTLNKNNTLQYTLHDGTNLISKENYSTGDSLEIDFEGKVKKMSPLKNGASVFMISGKNQGLSGKVKEILEGKIMIDINGEIVESNKNHIIVK